MTYARTTTVSDAADGDSVKQGCLDLDTDLTLGFTSLNTVAAALDNKAPISSKGTAGGVCDLDGDGLVPVKRLPTIPSSALPAGEKCPTGTVSFWPSTTIPDGFVECDGRWLSREDYADLYAVLGDRYGSNSTRFRVPDYRGRFLRGWDHGAGRDPDAAYRLDRGDETAGDAIGTTQESEILAHTHVFLTYGSKAVDGDESLAFFTPGSTEYNGKIEENEGKESRPFNVALIAIIKT